MRVLALCLAVLSLPAMAQDAQRGYIGIKPAELSKEVRTHFKIAEGVDRGLVLTHVFDNSAAAKAGLRVGDVLTSFDNKPVNSIDALIKLLDGMKPGRRVAYVARRGSGTIAGLLVLGKPPAERDVVREQPIPKREDDLDKRMEKAQRDIEELRARAEQRKAEAAKRAKGGAKRGKGMRVVRGPAPRNIVGWMEREEERIVAAKKSGNQRAVQWHSARMQMLRELRKAGYNTPTGSQRGEQAEGRMRKLEAKLADVLQRLAQLERRK